MSEDFYGGNIRTSRDRAKKPTEGLIAKRVLEVGFNRMTEPDEGQRSGRFTLGICNTAADSSVVDEVMVYVTKSLHSNPTNVDLIDIGQVSRHRPYIRSPISVDYDECVVIYATSPTLVARIDGYRLL